MTSQSPVPVASYLSDLLERSPLPQTEIARLIGLERPNVLSHIKKGRVRLPLRRIGPLAQALGIDPLELLDRVMQEYQPETWAAILPVIGPRLSEGEMTLIRSLRDLTGGPVAFHRTPEQLQALNRLARALSAPAATELASRRLT